MFYVNSRFLWCLLPCFHSPVLPPPVFLHLAPTAPHPPVFSSVFVVSSVEFSSSCCFICLFLVSPLDKINVHPLHILPANCCIWVHLLFFHCDISCYIVQRHFKTSSGLTDSGCVCLFFYFDLDTFVGHQLIMSSV